MRRGIREPRRAGGDAGGSARSIRAAGRVAICPIRTEPSRSALTKPSRSLIRWPSCAAAAGLTGDERVLEIGGGCGYGAAVLSRLAARVDTVERIAELAAIARVNLARVGYDNVEVHTGDGTLGLPERAPFDAIVVAAGASGLPDAYFQQLADGGRIVIPIGAARHGQIMYRFTRRGTELQSEGLGGFAFVPLVGAGPSHSIGRADKVPLP